MPLALRLVRKLPSTQLTAEARLLLAADELKRGRSANAIRYLAAGQGEGNLEFLAPILSAWAAADANDAAGALAILDRLRTGSLAGGLGAEHRALILLKFRRPAEAEPFARRALEGAGAREHRLRLAYIDGFVAGGDQARATLLAQELGTEVGAAEARIAAGRRTGLAIDNSAEAFSEMLLSLALDLSRLDNPTLPISLAQVARHAAPDNSSAAILLAMMLDRRGRTDEALALLRGVPAGDALAPQARDLQSRLLTDAKRFDEALRHAHAAASRREATVSDHARLGDVLSDMKRHGEAVQAYQRAIELSRTQKVAELWPLYLLKASALESGDRWPEARAALEQALALAPEQPLILNFLGYAKLERGEDLDSAEKMIMKAVALAPDDASIIDSLGWAQFKRGRVKDAIETLTQAAAKDPSQAEIHEHLGDALYTAGRRFEARFAWRAALLTAEDDIARRVQAKLETGLSPATAAP